MAIFYTEGVKYIKIARYDAYGNDNYQSLRQLDSVRIKTNDRGVINYPVLNITEYPSSSLNSPYFLYEIATTNITSSTNNQILNYKVDVQNTIAFTFDPATGAEWDLVEYDMENSNPLGYMDYLEGKYILGNTPNVPIIVTASANWNNNFFSSPIATNPIISLRKINSPNSNQIILQKSSSLSSIEGSITLTGSFTPIEGEIYGIFISDTLLTTPTRIAGNTLILTQSQSPVAGIGAQTVLEPYITTPFINSDYDVLMNNAVANRPNSFYMDVDFAGSQILPINQQTILGNSAAPAVIQDSNYSSAGWVNSRYIGKELTSQKINVYTEGDISYGPTPNVSNPKTYFVQFNWLAGTAPEWGNNSVGKVYTSIKYIIDENGNRIRPINDAGGVNLGTIRQSFSNNATIVLSNPNAFGADMSTLNTTVSVFKAGQKIKPIAYTQTASWDNSADPRVVLRYGYTGSIIFTQGGTPNEFIGTPVNDYRMVTFVPSLDTYSSTFLPNRVFEINGFAITGSYPKEISFNPPIQLGVSASFTTSSGLINSSTGSIYNPTGSLGQLSSSGYILYLESFMRVNSELGGSKKNLGVIIEFALQKSTDGGASWETLDNHQPYFPGNNSSFSTEFYLKFYELSATTSSLYRIAALNRQGGITSGNGVIQVADGSYFKVTQYPSPSTGNVTSFWMTGSNSNLLFAKKGTGGNNIGLNDVYGQKQQDINDSGFDPILLDFEPQPYDEIRFMGTEDQTYTILQVSQSLTSSVGIPNPYQSLTLRLDRNISPNINTDFFLLRRYVDDPGTIILNINKPAGGTSDGVLKPEFITSEVEAISKIILEESAPQ
jgi:hypothetical protein